MPDSIKLPPWVGTAVAVISLMLAIAGTYADNRAQIAVLQQRVVTLETANELLTSDIATNRGSNDGTSKRLARMELMVCLIGSHLRVPGLTSGDCNAQPQP